MWYYEDVKSTGSTPAILKNMQDYKANGYLRSSMMGSEIVWGDAKFKVPTKEGRKNQKNMVIFSMVARNAFNYLKNHTLRTSKYLPSEKWNEELKDTGRMHIVGTDINTAYWEIAYQMGILSEKTFKKGENHISNKAILLASLAALGSDKSYQVIRSGQLINKYVILKGNDQLKEVYKKIRYKCFKHMDEMAALLGKDFVCYKTDCIYYRNSAANVKKIRNYLEGQGFTFKMMKEPKNPKKEVIL